MCIHTLKRLGSPPITLAISVISFLVKCHYRDTSESIVYFLRPRPTNSLLVYPYGRLWLASWEGVCGCGGGGLPIMV